jgi:hypothetical protein
MAKDEESDDDSTVVEVKKEAKTADAAPPPPKKKKEPVNVLEAIRKAFMGKRKTPKELEKERIINKQRILEFMEINESWKFVWGSEDPKKWSDAEHIKVVHVLHA